MKLWVVIDEGCQECGVPSVPIGIFKSANVARIVADSRNAETDGWRDGGQTYCFVYPMTLPKEDNETS